MKSCALQVGRASATLRGGILPSYAPAVAAFWLVHLVYRMRAGGRLSVFDLLLPALLFGPWAVRDARWRIILSAATYFAAYYVAFLPLLDDISARAHWHEIPALEAWFFPRINPVVALQRYRTPLLNLVFCLGYSLHIANVLGPLLLFLWRRDLRNAGAFASAFLACGYLGFAIYLLYPVVPPRLALPEVSAVSPPWASHAWEKAGSWFRANPYAAMPSLHCAFPLLSYLYLRSIGSRLQWVFALMTAWLFFGTVYLGEHYVSDVVGAVPVAWAGSLAGRRAYARVA